MVIKFSLFSGRFQVFDNDGALQRDLRVKEGETLTVLSQLRRAIVKGHQVTVTLW